MNNSKFNSIEQLYKDYYNVCVCTVYKHIGNYYDAEDIVSDIFLNFIKHEPAKRINEKLLKETCHHMIKIYLSTGFSNHNKTYSFISRDPLELVLEQESREVLEKYVANYKRKYGKVMEMYLIRRIKPFEIGRILNVKGNTIAHKVKRGTVLLQEYLIKKGYR